MMPRNQPKYIVVIIFLIGLAVALPFFIAPNSTTNEISTPEVTVTATSLAVRPIPQSISIPDSPLKKSIIAAGDYIVRQQIANGELSYQVDVFTGAREYSPSYLRLMSGTGALYSLCRVTGDSKYCNAGDLALNRYLELLVTDPDRFKGTCLYTSGVCELGGSALTVDAIYKRWQATGNFKLGDRNLLSLSQELGYFILSMRKPEGGFYHAFDPHVGGTVDPNYYVIYFPGESLLALTELYDMTGGKLWLTQAHEVNDFMITQPITEDHWHEYALSMFANLGTLTNADKKYGQEIASTIIDGQVRSLNPKNSSISTATKIEALSAFAKALYLSGDKHAWLEPDIQAFITFVQARQIPDNNCNWEFSQELLEKFTGGIYDTCENPSIRIDGLQHYINGVITYLEYQSMTTQQ
ncbi:MAG: hypothetical protein U0Z26_01425 [Anaerolineales bacterium]